MAHAQVTCVLGAFVEPWGSESMPSRSSYEQLLSCYAHYASIITFCGVYDVDSYRGSESKQKLELPTLSGLADLAFGFSPRR